LGKGKIIFYQEEQESDALVLDLKKQIASRQAVAIVGAGISIGATMNSDYASWDGLLHSGVQRCERLLRNLLPDRWAERVNEEIDSNDMDDRLSAAEKITKKLRDREEYDRWLRDTIGSLRAEDRSVIEALHSLNVPIVTTNYDGLIEEVTGWHGATWRDRAEAQRIIRRDDRDEQGVLHLHGYWRNPESVVLGIRSYEDILRDEHARAMLQGVWALRTIFFVGFGSGLEDPNFDALLRWARGAFIDSDYYHYRLAREEDVATIQENHYRRGDRIRVLPYGEDPTELAEFLQTLADEEEKDRKTVSFEVTDELQEKNLPFSILHVRDGIDGDEAWLNQPHYLNTEDFKRYSTTIEYTKELGFQFKCFVDYGSNDYNEIERLLRAAKFHGISNEQRLRRAWFLLPRPEENPEYKEYGEHETRGGYVNNYFPRAHLA
jgi:hypothetical protein